MFENSETVQRAVLVGIRTGEYDADASIEELSELAKTAGAEVTGSFIQTLRSPDNATYVGKGKLLEIKEFADQQEADLLIFDDELSGSQIRNIEQVTGIDTIDRTLLILDIFAGRALSNEGKLQVELAQQKYLLPRLIGLGEQLSRQQGGIGSRGAGEAKLESDRRHIRRRIEFLEREIDKLTKQRERIRLRRKKNGIPSIAIVGYTNVGKSTLLNLLTDAGVLAEDMLFATLDPTARALTLKDGQTALLIDTIGLISRLPHQLVKAFHSTLEAAADADLIISLCDIASGNVSQQLQVTKELLAELGSGDIPVLTVCNKIDQVDPANILPIDSKTIFISAKENRGIDALLEAITRMLSESMKRLTLLIPYGQGRLLDLVRSHGKVLSEVYENEGIRAHVIAEKKILTHLEPYQYADD